MTAAAQSTQRESCGLVCWREGDSHIAGRSTRGQRKRGDLSALRDQGAAPGKKQYEDRRGRSPHYRHCYCSYQSSERERARGETQARVAGRDLRRGARGLRVGMPCRGCRRAPAFEQRGNPSGGFLTAASWPPCRGARPGGRRSLRTRFQPLGEAVCRSHPGDAERRAVLWIPAQLLGSGPLRGCCAGDRAIEISQAHS